jgi:nicotinamidase-related amidase
MPAIDQGALAVNNAKQLIEMARLIDVPIVFTEQNVKGRLRGGYPTVFALDFSAPRGNAPEPPD